jgi:putative hydrolase of the HAD superfamily
MAIDAVTFDFWNTLVRDDLTTVDRRVEAWQRLLAADGHEVCGDAIRAAYSAGWNDYVAAWHGNATFGAAEAVPVMLAALGVDVSDGARADLLDVFLDPPADRYPPLNPNIAECLASLRSSGVRVGIICDVGLTPSTVLRRYLDQQGVLELFDHWSFSDEVGTFKPDPVIFHHALSGLGGVAPGHAAHVGDLRRTDIAGALGMGMTAVRYTGAFDDPEPDDGSAAIEGTHVVSDHADLPAVLGLT